MTSTKRWFLGAAIALGLGACGRTDAVRVYESWADDACACKDADCMTKQEAQLGELAKTYAGHKIQSVDSEAIQAAGQRGSKCLVDLHKSLAK